MIRDLVGIAAEHWSTWFHEEPQSDLVASVLGGGPAHRDRFIVFINPQNKSPQILYKVAMSEIEAGRLRGEHAALSRVRPLLDQAFLETMPDPLGVFEVSGATVVATRILQGRRHLEPSLHSRWSVASRRVFGAYLRQSFDWSRQLAESTAGSDTRGTDALVEIVEKFEADFPESAAAPKLGPFRRELSRINLEWQLGWQHGDLTWGNALRHRGELRVVDWEHAQPEAEPWYDVAYSVGIVINAARMQRPRSSYVEMARSILADADWPGTALRAEIERAWPVDFPIGWGVALVAMKVASRQLSQGRGTKMWVDLVDAVFTDEELRKRAAWAVPQ